MRFFIFFFVLTCIEITLIAKVGSAIGFLNTFFLIIITAMVGSWQLKTQWRFVMTKMQSAQEEPSEAVVEAFVILLSGILLIIPGFLTDIIGILGLIPPIRIIVVRYLRHHSGYLRGRQFRTFRQRRDSDNTHQTSEERIHSSSRGNVFEGEFERKDD